MSGKAAEAVKIEQFAQHIEKSLQNEKVGAEDPYRDKVKAILNTLDRMKHGSIVRIAPAELNGLEGIVSACSCQNSRSGGLNGPSDVLSAEQMATRQTNSLPFTEPWASLMGRPSLNFSIMFHGNPGSGKSTLLLKFAEYLALNFGPVMYVSSEEHEDDLLSERVAALLNPRPGNLDFAPNLKAFDPNEYRFVILDSINDLGLKLPEFKNLKKQCPGVAFILVLQHTKDGDYRGGKDWEHDIQIAARVENGVATVYRNRYGIKGTLNFYEYFRTKPLQRHAND
jgi:predicted ATP-dependent serine protease